MNKQYIDLTDPYIKALETHHSFYKTEENKLLHVLHPIHSVLQRIIHPTNILYLSFPRSNLSCFLDNVK